MGRRTILGGAALLVAAALTAWLLLSSRVPTVSDGEAPDAAEQRLEAPPPVASTESADSSKAAGSLAGEARTRREPAAASAPGEAPTDEAAVGEPVDPAGPFQGVTVDDTGAPVPGARVEVTSGRGARGGIDPARFGEAKSGRDGRFEVPAPDGVSSIRVRASATGRVASRADEPIARGRLARIVLLRSVEIRVRVLDREGGAAVGGAKVGLLAGLENANRDDVDLPRHPFTVEGTTDEGGRAVLLAPGGPCALLVRAAGRAPRLLAPLWVPRAGDDVTVVLDRGLSVSGRVLAEDGTPVSGAKVHAAARLGWTGLATTDAEGAFRFDGLAGVGVIAQDEPILDDRLVAYVEAPGRPLQGFERSLHLEPLEGGDPLERIDVWELRLVGSGPVKGAVTANGASLEGVTVRLVPAIPLPEGLTDPAMPPGVPLDPTAPFRFEGVTVFPVVALLERADGSPVGESIHVTLEWPGGGSGNVYPLPRAAPPASTTRSVGVRVVDASGSGVFGAHIEAGWGDGEVLHLVANATTGYQGGVTLEGPAADLRAVVVHAAGRPSFSARLPERAPPVESTTIPLPTGRATGKARRLDGSVPATHLLLSTRLRGIGAPKTEVGRSAFAISESGRFEFDTLGTADEYVLTAMEPFRAVLPLGSPAIAPGAVLDVLLVTPAEAVSLAIEVRLELDGGATPELAWAQITFANAAGTRTASLRPTTEPGVRVADALVPPGVYDVSVFTDRQRTVASVPVRVDGGERPPRIVVRVVPHSN